MSTYLIFMNDLVKRSIKESFDSSLSNILFSHRRMLYSGRQVKTLTIRKKILGSHFFCMRKFNWADVRNRANVVISYFIEQATEDTDIRRRIQYLLKLKKWIKNVLLEFLLSIECLRPFKDSLLRLQHYPTLKIPRRYLYINKYHKNHKNSTNCI